MTDFGRSGTKRRQSRLFVASSVAAALIGFGVACSFPDVTFAPADNAEGGSTDGATADVSADVSVLIDGSDPNALIVKDAGEAIDASACAPTDCDCDKDGFRDLAKAACKPDAGTDAGASDCDDLDVRAHPGQGWLLDPPVAPLFGNWNCAAGLEKLHKPKVDCTALGAGSRCDATFGFEDDPGCGKTGGTFVTCKTVTDVVLFSKCVVAGRSLTEAQACR